MFVIENQLKSFRENSILPQNLKPEMYYAGTICDSSANYLGFFADLMYYNSTIYVFFFFNSIAFNLFWLIIMMLHVSYYYSLFNNIEADNAIATDTTD